MVRRPPGSGDRVDQVAVAHGDAGRSRSSGAPGPLPTEPGDARRGGPGQPHGCRALGARDLRGDAGRGRGDREHLELIRAIGMRSAVGRAAAGARAQAGRVDAGPGGVGAAVRSGRLAFVSRSPAGRPSPWTTRASTSGGGGREHPADGAAADGVPEVPGVRLAARYSHVRSRTQGTTWSAGTSTTSSGDRRGPVGGRVTIGDVCGKGAARGGADRDDPAHRPVARARAWPTTRRRSCVRLNAATLRAGLRGAGRPVRHGRGTSRVTVADRFERRGRRRGERGPPPASVCLRQDGGIETPCTASGIAARASTPDVDLIQRDVPVWMPAMRSYSTPTGSPRRAAWTSFYGHGTAGARGRAGPRRTQADVSPTALLADVVALPAGHGCATTSPSS